MAGGDAFDAEAAKAEIRAEALALGFDAVGFTEAHLPELVLGATRPKTLALAGELGDGVLLTGDTDVEALRAARAIVDEARAAAGREGRARVIVYTALDPGRSDLRDAVLRRTDELAAAGADAVAFHGTASSPDPRPFLDVLS